MNIIFCTNFAEDISYRVKRNIIRSLFCRQKIVNIHRVVQCRCQKEKWQNENNKQMICSEFLFQCEDVIFDLFQIELNNR